MAVTIKKATKLMAEAFIANVTTDNFTYITPVIEGVHGIGKSQSVITLAEGFDGLHFVIDATTTKEGEIGGMPFATRTEVGTEMEFAKHPVMRSIENYEKLFNKETSVAQANAYIESIMLATDCERFSIDRQAISQVLGINESELSEFTLRNATAEQRTLLLRNKLIKPIFVLLDEINRSSREVKQEMMNFTLNRTVNGYKLPWYTQIIGAMNPTGGGYTAEAMDPAQIDRMLYIRVGASLVEWLEWGTLNEVHQDVLWFLAQTGDKFFTMSQDDIDSGEQKANVSPRSWVAVSDIIKSREDASLNDLRAAFNEVNGNIEGFGLEDELAELISAKVGMDAYVAFSTWRKNKENSVRPEDVFNLDYNGKLPAELSDRISNKLTATARQVLVNLCLEYLQDNILELLSTNARSFDGIFVDFLDSLDYSTKIILAAGVAKKNARNADGAEAAFISIFIKYCPNSIARIKGLIDEHMTDLRGIFK